MINKSSRSKLAQMEHQSYFEAALVQSQCKLKSYYLRPTLQHSRLMSSSLIIITITIRIMDFRRCSWKDHNATWKTVSSIFEGSLLNEKLRKGSKATASGNVLDACCFLFFKISSVTVRVRINFSTAEASRICIWLLYFTRSLSNFRVKNMTKSWLSIFYNKGGLVRRVCMDACRKMSANYVIDTETVRKENKCAITQFQIYGL